jgi:hypothetical protein
VNNQETTKQDINKLIEFRQAIYGYALLARRDALFDLLDALICEGPVSSFPMLSKSSRFQRKWPSQYAAVEDGELDSQWLRNYLAWLVAFSSSVRIICSIQTGYERRCWVLIKASVKKDSPGTAFCLKLEKK